MRNDSVPCFIDVSFSPKLRIFKKKLYQAIDKGRISKMLGKLKYMAFEAVKGSPEDKKDGTEISIIELS